MVSTINYVAKRTNRFRNELGDVMIPQMQTVDTVDEPISEQSRDELDHAEVRA
jgi:hypothetical protein